MHVMGKKLIRQLKVIIKKISHSLCNLVKSYLTRTFNSLKPIFGYSTCCIFFDGQRVYFTLLI